MAEPRVQPVEVHCAATDLVRAIAAESRLDTTRLVCLIGRWAGGGAIIAWAPRTVWADSFYPDCAVYPDGAVHPDSAVYPDSAVHPDGAADGHPEPVADAAAPLGGGWFGCLGFDRELSWSAFFDKVLRQDRAGHWQLETLSDTVDLEWLSAVIHEAATSIPDLGLVTFDDIDGTSCDTHLAAVEHAISAIRAGELFQVNICARFTGRLSGDPLDLFSDGVKKLDPDYAAYLRTGDRTVVSLSPELFLQRTGSAVKTAPIKGTRRRTAAPDQLGDPAAVQLRRSAKDCAENIMIVDLMRNDLSRVCAPGSVRTSQLLTVRPAPGVWHLVSEVTGSLRAGVTHADLITATFPPGSVTGAPKLRALDLIDELEAAPRGLFTGAIGYLSPSGAAEFNVAIRTFEIAGDRFALGAGGGITSDSVPIQEWRECLIKAAPLFALGGITLDTAAGPPPTTVDVGDGIFETMLAHGPRIVGLSDHLTRLDASCREVYGLQLPEDLPALLDKALVGREGRHRVRVVVRPDDPHPAIEVMPAPDRPAGIELWTRRPEPGCWRHKWTDRRYLASLEASGRMPLFVSGGGHVRETSRSNIAIVTRPGVVATPPLTDDILPGTTRRRLLDAALDHAWLVEIRPVALSELRRARLVLSLSSIHGAVPVSRLDGDLLAVDDGLRTELDGWLV